MTPAAKARDRLQPALLDRLRDDEPQQPSEPPERRLISRAQLRQAVLRDLAWLLNTARMGIDEEAFPQAGRSVLAFGLPAWSGRTAASLSVADMEQAIRQAIADHEPRLLARTLEVQAVEEDEAIDCYNLLRFRISGQLWAQPAPLELLLQTDVDLETGRVEVRDLTG